MSMPIHFLSALLLKDAVVRHYPGGIEAFRARHAGALEDADLIRICGMSGGELQAELDLLQAFGFPLQSACAVADQMLGPLEECPVIRFTQTLAPSGLGPAWQAHRTECPWPESVDAHSAILTPGQIARPDDWLSEPTPDCHDDDSDPWAELQAQQGYFDAENADNPNWTDAAQFARNFAAFAARLKAKQLPTPSGDDEAGSKEE